MEIAQNKQKKMWDKLKFYFKEESTIKLTYNRITVSGEVTKMRKFYARPHLILNSNGSNHKIFIEDISPGSIFPNETKVEEHFVNPSHNRKSIPKSVRNEIWRDRFGDRFNGKCFVCKDNIRKDNFEAGHVISANDGGKDIPSNLRPICRTCNRSMGTQNLDQFKADHHS